MEFTYYCRQVNESDNGTAEYIYPPEAELVQINLNRTYFENTTHEGGCFGTGPGRLNIPEHTGR